jgi:Restriction endonuclease
MERGQFTFYREYAEAAMSFKNQSEQLSLFQAIIEYSLSRKYPERLSRRAQAAFDGLLSLMDRDWRSAAEIRASGKYHEWRKAVFQRDDYTCQVCGKRGVKLNAHHIKPFATHHELRMDIDNGITLCEKCHKEVHKRG